MSTVLLVFLLSLAGMIVGAVTIVVWYNVPVLKEFLYELVLGFILSLLATWVVSLATRTE
jgi:Na+/proline symporter